MDVLLILGSKLYNTWKLNVHYFLSIHAKDWTLGDIHMLPIYFVTKEYSLPLYGCSIKVHGCLIALTFMGTLTYLAMPFSFCVREVQSNFWSHSIYSKIETKPWDSWVYIQILRGYGFFELVYIQPRVKSCHLCKSIEHLVKVPLGPIHFHDFDICNKFEVILMFVLMKWSVFPCDLHPMLCWPYLLT